MPVDILRLTAFDGPNLYGPQPGVALLVRADSDCGRHLKGALKDGGQTIGIVIAYLDVDTELIGNTYLISVNFTTPTPALGVELARYAIAGLNATERHDQDWDAEGPLWELQKRRRVEALPLPALQLIAEASSRAIPTFVRADGHIQIGYGARGWSFKPTALKTTQPSLPMEQRAHEAPPFAPAPSTNDVPWERLGPIPIIAIAGTNRCDLGAHIITTALEAQPRAVSCTINADFAATQQLLTDPDATIAVVGLNIESIATRGVAFERCAYSAVTDLPTTLLPQGLDRPHLARIAGVPMLLTDPTGRVILNADEPEIAALAEYAPCPVTFISTLGETTTIALHRAAGGTALFVRDGLVIAAQGMIEHILAAATLPDEHVIGILTALGLLWAMGFTWEQIMSIVDDA